MLVAIVTGLLKPNISAMAGQNINWHYGFKIDVKYWLNAKGVGIFSVNSFALR